MRSAYINFFLANKVPWQTHQLYYLTLYELPQTFLIDLFQYHPRLFLIHLILFVLFFHLKTGPQLTSFDVNFRIWVTKFTRPCLQCLSAKRLNAILKCEKLSSLLSTSSVLFTNLNLTCAMQVMLVTHLATYTSELRNTKAQVYPSASTFVLNILKFLKVKERELPCRSVRNDRASITNQEKK